MSNNASNKFHEYEDNLNFQNARNLLQKCIKLNPGNIDAYLEYFTFELIFAENMTQRKNILLGNVKQKEENKNKKIVMLNDIITEKTEKEKMDVEEEKKDEENKKDNRNDNANSEIDNNDIKNLIIPEVIYDDSIIKLINNKKKKSIDELLSIHFGFLEKLEKYGTLENLNYHKLEKKIINNIQEILDSDKDNKNNLFLIDNQIKISKIKLLKYSKEELLNKIKIIFKEFENNLFINKYEMYHNYIAYHFLKYFVNEEEKNDNDMNLNLTGDNETYIEEVVKLVKPKINIEKLNQEILLYNNMKILVLISSREYLIKNILQTENYDLHTKIFDIFKLILQKNDLACLNDIFIIFNNIKNEVDSLIKNITDLPTNFIENDNNCFNFMKSYVEKIIDLISDDMTYYIKPELMKNYYEMINNQFIKGKANYIIIKELYYKMIEVIIDKCIQVNENDKNEDGKKYLLINGKSIINDIIKIKSKNSKNNFNFLNWIE